MIVIPRAKLVFLDVYIMISKIYLNGGFESNFSVILGFSISPEYMSAVGFQKSAIDLMLENVSN